MTLKTVKAQAVTDLAIQFDTDQFAEEVTYAEAVIDAIVSYGKNLDDAGGSPMATGAVIVKVSDVASPSYRDAVLINTVTWYVRRIVYGDGNVWKLEIYRDERPGVW